MGLVEWNGSLIEARIRIAAKVAIDETTKAAADEAERDHWYQNNSGHLEMNTINEAARLVTPNVVAGKFGTTRRRGFYGLILEYKQPFLRPVADRIFPTLAERLRKTLEL